MVHKADESKVMLVDWQMWGSGTAAREIAYFMSLSVDAEYERDLAFLTGSHFPVFLKIWHPS